MIMWAVIIGIAVFLYRHFAELAFEYNKQRTGFGALGVGIFIVGYFIFAFALGIVIALTSPELLGDMTTVFIFEFGAIGLAAGIAAIVRAMLKKSWAKQRASSQILDEKQ